MGRELSASRGGPFPIALPFSGTELTGIEWGTGPTAILFLHDPENEAASDTWGYWPDRFYQRGYRVLTIDLIAGHGNEVKRAGAVAARFLRARGSNRLMIVAAGRACSCIGEEDPDALVMLAPPATLEMDVVTRPNPKLIIGGSTQPDELAALKRLARASRGWTLLSTFATANDATALLQSRHADQIETQIATFLQEFRTMEPSTAS